MTAEDFIFEGLSLIEKGKRLIEYGEQLKQADAVKKKTSGHRTQAFIDELKREFFKDHNAKFDKKQQVEKKKRAEIDAMKRELILDSNARVLRQQAKKS